MSPSAKSEAKRIAGEIIVDEINDFLDRSTSPVSKGSFKRKKADGSDSELFEEGDMRSQITFEELNSDAIQVGIFDSAPDVERKKAFNHNVGDTLPQREFIPDENKTFKRQIMSKVNRAIKDIRDNDSGVNVTVSLESDIDQLIESLLGG